MSDLANGIARQIDKGIWDDALELAIAHGHRLTAHELQTLADRIAEVLG